MANVEIQRVEFQSPQAKGVDFPVNVVVENHETVAPLAGDHRCNTSGVGGHEVRVRLDIRHTDTGFTWNGNKTICAPIQSLVVPNARARFNPRLHDAGEYVVNAHVEAVGVSGQDDSQTYRLVVEEDAEDALTTGGTPGRTEDTSSTGQPGGGSGGNEPEDSGGDILSWVLNNQQKAAAILLVLAVLALAGPYAELASNVAGGSS